MNGPYLELAGASKSYDGGATQAMDIPSLTIAKGEFVSLLGPSGSGKTTTLMAIAGFLKIDKGKILLNGRSLETVPPHKRNIGVVFQNYALFPHLTVEENVFYPLRMRGETRSAAQSKIDRALDMVGLSGAAGRHPRQLSGGQQQRVALARTLVFNPDLILLDEPLGALDKNLREHMQVELRKIHRDLGVTMIYVTHDQTEAMTMSDRIAVFTNGRIDQIGTPDQIYHRPATRFVASFVGDSNILSGTAIGEDRLEVDGLGQMPLTNPSLTGGQTFDVLIRPEIIKLRPAGQGTTGHDAVIEDSINYGESHLVLLRVGDRSLRARMLSTDMKHLRPGDKCRAEWDPAYVHLIG
ncbi:ABC transporter ATP-binding protein [Corticibacterium sp. UT-5YL-CI-8]|nr:ABC transporter ATP-binding protein [Tianweitania sp. UT-5YL-CI-8]